MVTLASVQGSSLVPNLDTALATALKGFGTRRERDKEQAELDRKAKINELLEGVIAGAGGAISEEGAVPGQPASPGKQRATEEAAVLRILELDPALGKAVRDTLASGDAAAIEGLRVEAERGGRNAAFIQKQPDFPSKQKAINSLAAAAAARGEPVDPFIAMLNMNEDQLDLDSQRKIIAATDIKTLTKPQERKIIKDVTGVQRFVDTGDAVFPKVIEGGIPEEAAVVKASKILPNGAVIQSTSKGVRVFNAQGQRLSGNDVVEAIEAGQKLGIRVAGDTAAAKAAADEVKQSIALSGEMFKQVGPIRQSLLTIGKARQALAEGAETGVIDKLLPDLRESSIKLTNLMNQLGLEVISGATFGALSEGELRLALDTALPTGLQPEALDRWLQEKGAAQTKLLKELEDDILTLSSGGTISDIVLARRNAQEISLQQPGEAAPPPPASVAPPPPQPGAVLRFDSAGNPIP